jgi:hypothetical protein
MIRLTEPMLSAIAQGLEGCLKLVDLRGEPEDSRQIKRALRWAYERLEEDHGADISGVRPEILEVR